MIFTTNLGILHSWTQTSPPAADEFAEENIGPRTTATHLVGLRDSTARRHPHHRNNLTALHHDPSFGLPGDGHAPSPAPNHHRSPGETPTSSHP
jgi:hypothetical protein